MNFINRERDPNLVNLQNNVFAQMQNAVLGTQEGQTSQINLTAQPLNLMDSEALNAQTALKAALEEMLEIGKNLQSTGTK